MVDDLRLTKIIKNFDDPEPFSGVVYLTCGDDVLYARGFGNAIRSEKIPNHINTRFQMASGCKIFTSVTICQLVEQGKLSFDTRLSECVDIVFPNYAPEITIHHLLTHSSGITSYFEEDVNPDYESLWQTSPMYRITSPEDFLPMFQHKQMKFPPGERFEYNDGGYILLGLVIEQITGMKFTEHIQKRVFAPVGMSGSGYFSTDQLPGSTAYAYIRNPDGRWRTNFFAVPIVGAPDGGAYTTAPDMMRFWQALFTHRLLNREMTELMLAPKIVAVETEPATLYGYGVWINQVADRVRKYSVEGYDPGVAMRSTFYPRENNILTVIGNTSEALWPLYSKLEDYLDL